MTHEAVMTMANWYDVRQVHRKALECTEVSCFELVNCKPTCSLELAEIFTSGNSLSQSLRLAHSAHSALSLHGSCLILSASDASPWGEAKAAATWHGQTRQINANKANMATNQCPQRPQRRFHFLQNFAIFVHFSDKRGQKKLCKVLPGLVTVVGQDSLFCLWWSTNF